MRSPLILTPLILMIALIFSTSLASTHTSWNPSSPGPPWDPFSQLRAHTTLTPMTRIPYTPPSSCTTAEDPVQCSFAHWESLNTPVVITSSPVSSTWPAFSKWDPSYLSSVIRDYGNKVENIRVSTTPYMRYHNDLRPATSFQSLPSVSQAHEPKCYTHGDMSVDEFLESLKDGENGVERWAYYGDSLDFMGPTLRDDVEPLDWFVVRNESWTPSKSYAHRKTQLWFGRNSTVTPLHYDASPNFHVVVAGAKAVVLFPPSAWSGLGLFPHLHPRAKQGGVELYWDPAASTFGHADPRKTRGVMGFETIIREGDVLIIPPFWGHTLVSISPVSISVNVWTVYMESHLLPRLMSVGIPSPRAHRESPVSTLAVRLFIRYLVALVYEKDPEPFLRSLWEDRYAGLAQSELQYSLAHFDQPLSPDWLSKSRDQLLMDDDDADDDAANHKWRSYCEEYLSDMTDEQCETEWLRPNQSPTICRGVTPVSAPDMFSALASPFHDAASQIVAEMDRVIPGGAKGSAARIVLGNLVELHALTAVNSNLLDVAPFLHSLARSC